MAGKPRYSDFQGERAQTRPARITTSNGYDIAAGNVELASGDVARAQERKPSLARKRGRTVLRTAFPR